MSIIKLNFNSIINVKNEIEVNRKKFENIYGDLM